LKWPLRPFEGVSSGATRASALRRTCGPLWGSRRDRGHLPTCQTDMGSVGPLGVSTPSGLSQTGSNARIAPHAAPIAFASLQRSIAAPPHRPGTPRGPRVGRCFLPWAFVPHDTFGTGNPLPVGRPAPRRAACEVWLPPSRRTSPTLRGALRLLERPQAFTFEAFSSRRSESPLGDPCPPAVHHVDSPRSLRCVRTRPASGPCSRRRVRCAARPLRAAGLDASLVFLPPERSPPPSLRAHRVRARSLRTRWAGLTSRPACVSRCCGTTGSACPSRDCQLSWDFSPCDRHGTAWERAEGGLMDSPHDGGRCTRPPSF